MISFIIPAYNAEKTIKRAVESIVNQKETTLDFEIVVIDDGSNDKTEEIVKVYPEVNYYKTENKGVSAARNLGIKKAKGDYIIFVDSDDYVSDSLLSDIEKYIEEGIELIKWNPIFVNDDGEEISKEPCFPFEKTDGKSAFNLLYGKDKLISCLWNYAIKKSLAPKFPEGRMHEDFAKIPLMILSAKSMVFIDKNEYYYVQTESSIMRGNDTKKQRKKLEDVLANYDDLLVDYKKLKLDKFTEENLKIFLTNSLLVILPDLEGDNLQFFKKELKNRKVYKDLKARNIKQLAKKILVYMDLNKKNK